MTPRLLVELVTLFSICAFLRRRRNAAKRRLALDALSRKGAVDCATNHCFSHVVIRDAAMSHQIDYLEAHEAYRRGFNDADAKLTLRDIKSLNADLAKERSK